MCLVNEQKKIYNESKQLTNSLVNLLEQNYLTRKLQQTKAS